MQALCDLYPEVSSVTSKYNFYDSETDKLSRSSEERKLNLELLYNMKVNCMCWECVSGGYDLDNILYTAVKEKRTEITGSIKCMGWQDKQRINKHRCFTRLEYFLNIEYK
jgi:hypothetical protein